MSPDPSAVPRTPRDWALCALSHIEHASKILEMTWRGLPKEIPERERLHVVAADVGRLRRSLGQVVISLGLREGRTPS